MAERLVENRWTVAPEEAARAGRLGPRLDDFLADRVPLVSRMHLQSSIRSGAVLVDGRRVPPGFRLHAGAQVEARLDLEAPSSMTPEDIPIEVLWEDDHLAVVVKPAGMLVHPTRGVKSGTLANALSGLWNGPGRPPIRPVFVHRLDKETSGLMAVAKTRAAGARLAKNFTAGQAEKRYLAWLDGVLAEDERTIDAPIARVSEDPPQWRVDPDGKLARTELAVGRRTAGRTLVRLSPSLAVQTSSASTAPGSATPSRATRHTALNPPLACFCTHRSWPFRIPATAADWNSPRPRTTDSGPHGPPCSFSPEKTSTGKSFLVVLCETLRMRVWRQKR